ncbi:SWIM zinc finger family protein [Hymenobacter daeguensis]
MISFTEAQAQSLITDPGTLKRGQELLKPAKWANLGRTDTAAWGECAGSGSRPYLTGIDLTEPAFKCSCPSRVFPCKHGAGLLLLMARQPELLTGHTPPAWLAEWLQKRQQTQEKKVEKAPSSPAAAATNVSSGAPSAVPPLHNENAPSGSPSPREKGPGGEVPAASDLAVDPKRLARMAAGADDLAAWLEDLVRAGLATLNQQPARFWESQAARLVDNQLPGLAAAVRELATLRHAHADWPARLLGRLGELYLLVRAFRNLPSLGPDARPEILQQVGINLKKEDLLATAAPVADAWRVLGQFRWDEDRLSARRTWLSGRHTGRTALVLEFSFGGQPFGTPFIPHGSYLGEVAFYPGLLPLRAAPVSVKFDGTVPPGAVPAGQSISQLLHDYAAALARQPWLREWPATLSQVLPTPLPDGRWQLHHATEAGILPLRLGDENFGWQLLAESGGQPVTLFGEWDGQAFRPLTGWNAGETALAAPAPAPRASVGRQQDADAEAAAHAPRTQDASANAGTGPARAVDAAKLLRIALLGTRQSGEVVPPFPTPADSAEQQLLLAAGTLALMRKAGHQPAPATGPPLTPAPAERLPAIGPKGTDYLHQMLVNGLHPELVPDYLTSVAARHRLVPPALLVPLLHQAGATAETRAAAPPVLGNRGHWLASLNPAWVRLTDGTSTTAEANPATWETGTLAQRRAWLTERFAQAPDEARALLLAALPGEPAKTQEALLEILGNHLHPDAEPTLEALLRARGQDVRRLAAGLLVRLPGAALVGRLWARAVPLLSTRRGLLGLGKATLDIRLPDAWDKTWLLDGIEEQNTHFSYLARANGRTQAIGAGAARLANLLAWVPVDRWVAQLNATPAELLAQALASDWAMPVLMAWAESAATHQSPRIAAAFVQLWLEQAASLAQAGIQLPLWKLVPLLPAAEQQRLLLVPLLRRLNRPAGTWEGDWELLEQTRVLPGPWPWALTAATLAVVARHTADTALALPYLPRERYRFGYFVSETLRDHIAPTDAAAAQKLLAEIPDAHDFYRTQFQLFADTLKFQADLAASLHE